MRDVVIGDQGFAACVSVGGVGLQEFQAVHVVVGADHVDVLGVVPGEGLRARDAVRISPGVRDGDDAFADVDRVPRSGFFFFGGSALAPDGGVLHRVGVILDKAGWDGSQRCFWVPTKGRFQIERTHHNERRRLLHSSSGSIHGLASR